MATTSPDNLRTPNPGDPFNLVPDLATFAQDVQNAFIARGNVSKGTAAQRAAFLSTAVQGMLWQDTDGIKMIWRKDGAAWVPAVWQWAGTAAQMNGFTLAPEGFTWSNTSDNSTYTRVSGAWTPGSSAGTWESLSALFSTPSNWPSGSGTPGQIRLNGDNVELRGVLENSTVFSSLTAVGTLPVKYRPANRVTINSESALTPTVRKAFRVEPSGQFQVYSPSGGTLQWWFDSISWSTKL